MERNRFFRRSWMWIGLVALIVVAGLLMFSGGETYKKVDTSEVYAQINKDNVKRAVIADKEQTVNLDLKTKTSDGVKIQAQVPADVIGQVFDTVKTKQAEG